MTPVTRYLFLIGTTVPFLACSTLLAADPAVLSTEHVDIGLAYEDGQWDLHLHDETNDIEYHPSEAVLQVNASALTAVPNDPRYAFLGASGSPIFILPGGVQDPNLLYLGTGAEEIDNGVFVQDRMTLRLTGFSGPGKFVAYLTDGVSGGAQRVVEAENGSVDPAYHSFTVLALGHQDYNWGFTAPGTYRLTLQASGDLIGQGLVTSDAVDYTFVVVPEPGPVGLLGLGIAGLAWYRTARRSASSSVRS